MALWGIQDQFCPVSGADTIEQHLPGAEVIRIDQCGHWVMVEHSDLFNTSCLRFLSRG
jgi:4,5:9,10-diseco-3-hydroxy-5,9,17-trioxoandrosta-1(10),2-diene-4-oate hydrolase